jgi:hypothetical protein
MIAYDEASVLLRVALWQSNSLPECDTLIEVSQAR